MKAEIINPFITATIHVLSTMAFITPKAGQPYLKKDDKACGDVSSIVGITGDPDGTFSISFEKSSMLAIASNMFGEAITELSDDVADATGEIANMISGQARRELDEKGLHFEGAVPSVITGDHHEIKHISDGPKIAVPFTTDNGNFTVELCFNS